MGSMRSSAFLSRPSIGNHCLAFVVYSDEVRARYQPVHSGLP
jgi:hypothetical protein